ncbi:hypothetical protein [Haloprofundus salilacus]|uniref:hypothetical protein n=1 Tax=Haloprofundus salilacus TaxID=2876190 RepID=UPI001CCC390C|nr:hypothetical protein [Haloprofundus salilacus]
MGQISDWWFSRVSNDEADMGDTRVFVKALGGNVLHILLFFLLLVNAVLRGHTVEQSPSLGGLLLTIIFGLSVGAATPLHTKNELLTELAETFWYRAILLLVIFGGFWLLLGYNISYGIWFGLTFVVAKAITTTLLYIQARSNCN